MAQIVILQILKFKILQRRVRWEYMKNVPSDLLGQEQKNLPGQNTEIPKKLAIFVEKNINFGLQDQNWGGRSLGHLFPSF